MPERNDLTTSEHSELSTSRRWTGGWLAALLTAGATIVWCLLIYALIHDRPTHWQYGATPYVPAESVLSSEPPPRGAVPNQVVLPLKTPGGPNAKR